MSAFTVYGRPGCGYCHMAQHALESAGYEYQYIDIYRQGLSKEDLAKRLGKPVRTVPQILHGDKYIGGYTELRSYLSSL